jgi:hypothetical protein
MSRRSLSVLAAAAVLAGATVPALAQSGPPAAWHDSANRPDLSQMAVNRFFDKLDPDRTGKVTRAAYLADAKKTFDRIDIDKTGKLTKSEIALWASRHHGRGHGGWGHRGGMMGWGMHPMMGAGGGNDAGGAPASPRPRPSGAPNRPAMRGPFADIPRDASGSITLDAYMAWAGKKFDAIDTAHSGTITVASYRAYVKDQMAKRRADMAKRRATGGWQRGPRPWGSPAPKASPSA